MDIYSLKGLAKKEGVSYEYMRKLAAKIAKGEITTWRSYKFFGPGKRYWLAYPETEKLTFHDLDEE